MPAPGGYFELMGRPATRVFIPTNFLWKGVPGRGYRRRGGRC